MDPVTQDLGEERRKIHACRTLFVWLFYVKVTQNGFIGLQERMEAMVDSLPMVPTARTSALEPLPLLLSFKIELAAELQLQVINIVVLSVVVPELA